MKRKQKEGNKKDAQSLGTTITLHLINQAKKKNYTNLTQKH